MKANNKQIAHDFKDIGILKWKVENGNAVMASFAINKRTNGKYCRF